MSLITRKDKGGRLSIDEMDNNLMYLQGLIVPSFKDITNDIIDLVYTFNSNDFNKTLVYSGNENITILLSTNIEYNIGNRFSVLQKGIGEIELVVDGFIISTLNNEIPSINRLHASMDITIFSNNLPEVLVTGKLKTI